MYKISTVAVRQLYIDYKYIQYNGTHKHGDIEGTDLSFNILSILKVFILRLLCIIKYIHV